MKCIRKYFFIMLFFFSFCSPKKESADIIVHNAIVYTVDSSMSVKEAFAVKNGKILSIGTNNDILSKYDAKEKIDAQGKSVFPGFIDAHCHFLSYGLNLQKVNLVETKSFDEVIKRVVEFSKTNKSEWITGRGWDQNDWDIKEFPNRVKLDSLFPNTPVFLKRVDGHAALVNSAALRKANITGKTKVNGGIVEMKNGNLTGILIDNAVDLIANIIPPPSNEKIKNALLFAQKNCFAVGLTTIDDAGLEKQVVDLIDEMQKNNELKMRVYAMLSDSKENLNYYLQHGTYKTERLNVRSFKFYADGSLGSRGACLLQPYSDKPNQQGFLISKKEYYKEMAQKMFEKGFQMNTHCIGDSGVRLILDTYKKIFITYLDSRWRIEHFQVTTKSDISSLAFLKSKNNIIPSIQPTHATSDMYWAKDRLGNERVKYAYAYKDLLKATDMVALGTDFPVENINPLYTFYAAVARKDLKGFPEEGFQTENALTREETLKGMTLWAAYSNFEEKEKGSIERGKFADFVILDKDIMKINIDEVPKTKVICTYINGEKVYPVK
ncbi:MAG: amidohydrolase family protein [Bacteroidota bacterium]